MKLYTSVFLTPTHNRGKETEGRVGMKGNSVRFLCEAENNGLCNIPEEIRKVLEWNKEIKDG